MSLKWFFYDVFSNLERGFLLESQGRQHLVDYFNMIIERFRDKEPNSDGKTECKLVVQAVIEFHEQSKLGNNNICLFGKYHNILFVAAKICYEWDLQETETVHNLLTSIYSCEKTFEKFFECSIFGAKVTQLISGWRSDYRDIDENFKASEYFLKHSIRGKFKFPYDNQELNFVDVPMPCYEKMSPLKTAVKAENWKLVTLLINYGARTHLPLDHKHYKTYSLLRIFAHKLEKYNSCCFYKENLVKCFKLFIRSIPLVSTICKYEFKDDENSSVLSILFDELSLQNVTEPRTLKHLARCAARNHLSENHQLPVARNELGIPKSLEQYLNLETD